jgi:lambda repressor-like predicted transcriptional regulator
MAVAARLRAEGLSLRQIAARQSVCYQTVANDLARWDREHPAMPAEIVRLSRSAVKNVTPGATDLTPDFDSGTNVIPLRRPA